jgi:3-isopropylmalate dehydrogenase
MATSQLWREIASELAADFPDVELQHRYVDSCAMDLVRIPETFDVMVMDNLFGDILSDLAAVLAGSIGLLPSASLGEVGGDGHRVGLYEPIHGSAPDIAGRDVANPVGTIRSAAMMLRLSYGQEEAATGIEAAVAATLAAGFATPDLPQGPATKRVGTAELARQVVARLPR